MRSSTGRLRASVRSEAGILLFGNGRLRRTLRITRCEMPRTIDLATRLTMAAFFAAARSLERSVDGNEPFRRGCATLRGLGGNDEDFDHDRFLARWRHCRRPLRR